MSVRLTTNRNETIFFLIPTGAHSTLSSSTLQTMIQELEEKLRILHGLGHQFPLVQRQEKTLPYNTWTLHFHFFLGGVGDDVVVKSGEVNGRQPPVDLAVTLPGRFHLLELDSRQGADSSIVTLNWGHPQNRKPRLFALGFVLLIPVAFGWLVLDEAYVVWPPAKRWTVDMHN